MQPFLLEGCWDRDDSLALGVRLATSSADGIETVVSHDDSPPELSFSHEHSPPGRGEFLTSFPPGVTAPTIALRPPHGGEEGAMAYREVTMIEITEVLRQWLAGGARKTIARRLGLDPKTVRRYLRAAAQCELQPGMATAELTEARVGAIVTALRAMPPRAYGESWQQCVAHREMIATHLRAGVRVSKIRRLLARQGVTIAAATLYRFATAELGVGRAAATVAVADGAPGEELYVDTGWMTLLVPDETRRRRRFRAWIFTPGVSRYRFVYPCFGETAASAIAACEAAWAFYGGVFKVLIPDNTKAIVTTPDALQPRLTLACLEYAQALGFVRRSRTIVDRRTQAGSVRPLAPGSTQRRAGDARQQAARGNAERDRVAAGRRPRRRRGRRPRP